MRSAEVRGKEVKHYRDCILAMKAYAKAKAEFEENHPGYCRSCGGWGGHWYRYDPSPAGVSLAPGYMEDFAECPDCVDQGKCPWCGSEYKDRMNGVLVCGCGWSSDKESKGLPEQPECWCDLRRQGRDVP